MPCDGSHVLFIGGYHHSGTGAVTHALKVHALGLHSISLNVTADHPPTLLIQSEDGGFSYGSIYYYLALKQAGVAGELHIYSNGGHGFGLRPSKFACSNWPKRCEAWLRAQGLLVKK